MKTPSADLAQRLFDVSEEALYTDPPPRLEDIAQLVGASRATLYYYFSGRDDLLAFLLAEHAKKGAQRVEAVVNPDDRPELRLRAMVATMVEYLGNRPGVCAGLLGALGATGRMSEALQANDTWIAGPLRELLAAGQEEGAFVVENIADAANAIVGAVLLGVLGRSMSGADATDRQFRRQLTEQVLQGVLTH